MSNTNLADIKPLTNEDIAELLSMKEEELSINKTLELLNEIINQYDKFPEEPLIYKMLLITKSAFLRGFEHGINTYNEGIIETINEECQEGERNEK